MQGGVWTNVRAINADFRGANLEDLAVTGGVWRGAQWDSETRTEGMVFKNVTGAEGWETAEDRAARLQEGDGPLITDDSMGVTDESPVPELTKPNSGAESPVDANDSDFDFDEDLVF